MGNRVHTGKNAMRICIFADIHGNIDALEKMLDCETGETDLFIFAGDIWGYFYGQKEIIDIFMSMPNLVAIKGNHEKFYLSGKKMEKLTDKYGSSYKIHLTNNQQRYIEKLPNKVELIIKGKHIGVFHGGPYDYLEQRLYPDSLAYIDQIIKEFNYDYLILGHTHYQVFYKTKGTIVINPGSLGQPRDGKGFSYCLLNTETGSCTYKNVDIEISKLLKLVEEKDADKYVLKYLKNKYSKQEVNS